MAQSGAVARTPRKNQSYLARLGRNIVKHKWTYMMMIPVLALLPLIENVTVHNMIDSEHRMQVKVYVDDDGGRKAVVVENPVYPKQFKQETHGTGLLNLGKRFTLLTGKQVSVKDDGKVFKVVLPLS